MAAPGLEWRYPVVQARRGIVLRAGRERCWPMQRNGQTTAGNFATGRSVCSLATCRRAATTCRKHSS